MKKYENITTLAVLAALLAYFYRFFPLKGDLIAHFLLVDEIIRHRGVRPAPVANLGAMAYYPAGSHWLAAIFGWVTGSGLTGLVVASIISVYVLYLLVIKLADGDSCRNLAAFALVFLLLVKTHSLVGWEILGNFFYPQLVADLILFATLIWLSKTADEWWRATFVIGAGALAMFVQPLVAVHVLGAGAMLMGYEAVAGFACTRRLPLRPALAALLIVVATGLLAIYHPSFRAMRQIAEHDGELNLGYARPLIVGVACAMIGMLTLWRHFKGRSESADAVLGSAVLASFCLALLQYGVLRLSHAGSDYAVKKHMFIVLTLGSLNVTRLLAPHLRFLPAARLWIAPPIVAGLMSAFLLKDFDRPISPVMRALNFANKEAIEVPGFVPGNAVDLDRSQPQLIDMMITMSAFQHPYTWFGDDILHGARYAMIQRTPDINANCQILSSDRTYALVAPDCLNIYQVGTKLIFGAGGNGQIFLRDGWGMVEPWGVWSNGDQVASIDVTLAKPSSGPLEMIADVHAFTGHGHPAQTILIYANGTQIATWNFASEDMKKTATIPTVAGSRLNIAFKTPNATSPVKVIPGSTDTRILGLGLRSLTINPAP